MVKYGVGATSSADHAASGGGGFTTPPSPSSRYQTVRNDRPGFPARALAVREARYFVDRAILEHYNTVTVLLGTADGTGNSSASADGSCMCHTMVVAVHCCG